MPRILRGIVGTAVVAGTSTAVSNRVSRRQAGRWGAARPTGTAGRAAGRPRRAARGDIRDGHQAGPAQQLDELKAQGLLSASEFAAQKARILDS